MQFDASTWALRQWGQAHLGDVRLTRQAVRMGTRMAAQPEGSLPEQMQHPAGLKAAYRLLNNPKVTLDAWLQPHWEQTRSAAQQAPVVLWVEDTTELDYTAHPSKTGLGPIGNGKGRGLLLHSTLAVLPETHRVLGVGHTQAVLRRPTPRPVQKWNRSPESRLWETSTQVVGPPPAGVTWVHVSDAGSDIFAYLVACRAQGTEFIVRACRNRKLLWEPAAPEARRKKAASLLDYLRSLPPQPNSGYPVHVPAEKKHPARDAQVVMQWAQVTLPPPAQAPVEIRQETPLSGWALRVWEPHPPRKTKRVEWVLLSSRPLLSRETVDQTLDWYTHRWLCEDYHQALKTGCRVEHTQLDDEQDLERLLGFLVPIAVRLLQLRQAVRETPEVAAPMVIDPLMVEVLQRRQGHPAKLLTIREFWLGVARLGGHQGRPSDGPPGWRTIWRGWRVLSELTEGARLVLDDNTS